MIIAVDGPAASGKGTVARLVARRLGYPHLDTGLLYRAIARRLLDECGGALDRPAAVRFAAGLDAADLGDFVRLRDPEVDGIVASVAAWQEVRDEILEVQRRFAACPPGGAAGAVLDGRDIGSVVVPEADVKVYITADLEVRAERRARELAGRGLAADRATVLASIRERDALDSGRAVAPLRRAEGAYLLDTTYLGIDEAADRVMAMIAEKLD